MTSPNEPGHAGQGDSPTGNGSVERSDAPATPRKRPAARGRRQAQQRQSGRGTASPNAEARLNRFISGTAAPGATQNTTILSAEPAPAPAPNESRQSRCLRQRITRPVRPDSPCGTT